MTFEEFFQKKRIDLTRLQAGEPALFFEFKLHFEQMGEKSFDYTKKYWFNKLRLQYHLAPEQKPEKMHLENRLAEQTITEALSENIPAPSPKVGFKSRFNSGVANAENDTPEALVTQTPEENPAGTAVLKPAFKPRFNPKMVVPKPAEETEGEKREEEAKQTGPKTEGPDESLAPKLAFQPRFNMKMAGPKTAEGVKDKAEEPAQIDPASPIEKPTASPVENTAVKPGFKPRFNMKMVAPKSAEEEIGEAEMVEPVTETSARPTTENPAAQETPQEDTTPRPVGFKPRFNAAKMKPKPPQE